MSKLIWNGAVRRIEKDTKFGMVTGIGLSVGGGRVDPPTAERPPAPDAPRPGARVDAEQLEPPPDRRAHRSGRFKL